MVRSKEETPESNAEAGLSDADYQALTDFRLQLRRFLYFSEESARLEGLEAQQHQLLLAIRGIGEPGGPTIGQLAEHLLIRHHSAVGLVDRLEERTLVDRLRSEGDRRQVRVRLTAKGAAILKRLSSAHRTELLSSGPSLVESLTLLLKTASGRLEKEPDV